MLHVHAFTLSAGLVLTMVPPKLLGMKIRPRIRQQLIQAHIKYLSNCHYVDQAGIGWTPGSRLAMLQLLICEPGKVGIISNELLAVVQSCPSALYVQAHYYGVIRPSTRYLRMCHRAKKETRDKLSCLTGNTISVRHYWLFKRETNTVLCLTPKLGLT